MKFLDEVVRAVLLPVHQVTRRTPQTLNSNQITNDAVREPLHKPHGAQSVDSTVTTSDPNRGLVREWMLLTFIVFAIDDTLDTIKVWTRVTRSSWRQFAHIIVEHGTDGWRARTVFGSPLTR